MRGGLVSAPASQLPAEEATRSQLDAAELDLIKLQEAGSAVAWPRRVSPYPDGSRQMRRLRRKTADPECSTRHDVTVFAGSGDVTVLTGSGGGADTSSTLAATAASVQSAAQAAVTISASNGERVSSGSNGNAADELAFRDLLDLQAAGIKVVWPRSIAAGPR